MNELTSYQGSFSIWEEPSSLDEIKQIYASNLSDGEWKTFVGIGKATNLNPFLREIWCVKYNNKVASIFIGRDGYRKNAQSHKDYDGHFVDAVYSEDDYRIDPLDLSIHHAYNVKKRGDVCGAYCLVYRKSISRPSYVYVDFKEYSTNMGLWTSKPATMIKKVAEAQALRMAFQELFAGTYDEVEQWEQKTPTTKKNSNKSDYQEINTSYVENDLIASRKNESTSSSELGYNPYNDLLNAINMCSTASDLKEAGKLVTESSLSQEDILSLRKAYSIKYKDIIDKENFISEME